MSVLVLNLKILFDFNNKNINIIIFSLFESQVATKEFRILNAFQRSKVKMLDTIQSKVVFTSSKFGWLISEEDMITIK
jgi:hypothetical protein